MSFKQNQLAPYKTAIGDSDKNVPETIDVTVPRNGGCPIAM